MGKNLSKATSYLVVQDPQSSSTKVKRARASNTPIVSADELTAAFATSPVIQAVEAKVEKPYFPAKKVVLLRMEEDEEEAEEQAFEASVPPPSRAERAKLQAELEAAAMGADDDDLVAR